jgi:hypothetical protein
MTNSEDKCLVCSAKEKKCEKKIELKNLIISLGVFFCFLHTKPTSFYLFLLPMNEVNMKY